ncbi:MAG: tRNA (adenosine(37)-N6)-threonylcarbamoyltransferase complex ATPase subunit type 1 TsaE [Myxococcota bacterium]|nr:tRNA (adenosine(37)-N6)-threonylcarbamoyltransferase complex ATPase subunit type 1 TsaE [Myxococcota bacterium]
MSTSIRTPCWASPSPETTAAAARALVGACEPALRTDAFVIALHGELGAGKTVFAKGLGEGFGFAASQLASPTFTIASAYPIRGGGELVHVDLYRLESATELESAGFDDWLAPGNLVAIEWADRFPKALPADRLEVSIGRSSSGLAHAEKFGDDSGPAQLAVQRELRLRALGPIAAEVLAIWQQELSAIPGLEVERD